MIQLFLFSIFYCRILRRNDNLKSSYDFVREDHSNDINNEKYKKLDDVDESLYENNLLNTKKRDIPVYYEYFKDILNNLKKDYGDFGAEKLYSDWETYFYKYNELEKDLSDVIKDLKCTEDYMNRTNKYNKLVGYLTNKCTVFLQYLILCLTKINETTASENEVDMKNIFTRSFLKKQVKILLKKKRIDVTKSIGMGKDSISKKYYKLLVKILKVILRELDGYLTYFEDKMKN